MTNRPGVMFYFEVRPCLDRLSMEERGMLFEAILDYGQLGLVPQMEGALGVAWDFIRPKLDLDAERYEETCQKRRQAALARWEKEHGDANASFALQTMPNSNSKTKTNSISISNPNANSKGGADGSAGGDFNHRRNAALARLAGL